MRKNLVLDFGSGYIRIGDTSYDYPEYVIPSIVGRFVLNQENSLNFDLDNTEVYGDVAALNRSNLIVNHPISEGIVKSWVDFEKLFDYILRNKVKINFDGSVPGGIDPRDCTMIISEAPNNSYINRNKLATLFFEKYHFGRIKFQLAPMLSLYAQGLTSGLVVNSGEGVTTAVAVIDGFMPVNLVKRNPLNSKMVQNQLYNFLLLKGYNFEKSSDFETIRQIKESKCFVAYDYPRELELSSTTSFLDTFYELPDGTKVSLGRERFQAPEVLFTPGIGGYECDGISNFIFNLIQEADIENRRVLYEHVVISGGNTMFPGFESRLLKDLKHLYRTEILRDNLKREKKVNIRIEAPPRRNDICLLGGIILSRLISENNDFWVSKDQYDEFGEKVFKNLLIL